MPNTVVVRPCPECGGMGWPNGCGPESGYEGPCHGAPHILDWNRFVRSQLADAVRENRDLCSQRSGGFRLAAIAHAALEGGVNYLIDRSLGEAYRDLPSPGPAIFFGGDAPPRIDWVQDDRMEEDMESYIVVAGDCGVFSGWAQGGVAALGADGRVELRDARHLRRYYVAGCTGDGSAAELASRGLDPASPSVTPPVPGITVLLGVRRAFSVAPEAIASFL